MMPDSASGVSMTRSSPKSFCSPSVTRKTPPSLPMSSPIRMTLGLRSMAARRPLLMPLAMVIVAMSVTPFAREAGVVLDELPPLALDERVLLDVDVVEHRVAAGVGHVEAALADGGGQLVGLLVDGVEEVLVGLLLVH